MRRGSWVTSRYHPLARLSLTSCCVTVRAGKAEVRLKRVGRG
jgi:hypothetical protein